MTQVNFAEGSVFFLNIPVWSKKPRFFLALNRLLFLCEHGREKNRFDAQICGILRAVGVAQVVHRLLGNPIAAVSSVGACYFD